MDETISILMPVYNRQTFVLAAIQSILNQTYKNIKLIIYDDGSTDRTAEIIEQIKDSRISIFKEAKNRGVAHARNKLLEFCDTKYAAWQDSDDLSNKHRIEMQYAAIKNKNLLVYSRYLRLGPSSIQQSNEAPVYLKTRHTANASLMFPVDKQILFNEKLKIGEDVEWQHRMTQNNKEFFIDYVLYYVRFHNDRLGIQYKNYNWQKALYE